MQTRYFFIFLFTIGLFASYYSHQLTDQATPISAEKEKDIVEMYLTHSSSSTLNQDGSLKGTLESIYSEKFTSNKKMTLTKPNIGIYTHTQKWLLTADSASYDKKNNTFALQDNVRLEREDQQARMTTTELFINNEKNLAFTKAPVNIQIDGSNTDSTGIKINMQDETISLPANVRTSFKPPRK